MQFHTTSYRSATGWDAPLPAGLDHAQTLVLAFGASGFADDSRPFDELAAAFPQAVMAGCSTAGEIAAGQVHDASVSVAIARFDHVRLAQVHTELAHSDDSEAAGKRLADRIDPAGLRAVFVLSDGLSVNGTRLVASLARHLPADVAISGGLSGDGSRFQRTWVLSEGRPHSHRLCAVAFYGERLRVGLGCAAGWLDFGPERYITRSEGHVLYELDGKPALDLYKEYLGVLADGLPGAGLLFPLSIRPPLSDRKPLVRTVLAVDESLRSLTFAGDVPQGHIARLMRATNDGLIHSASTAVQLAARGVARDAPALVVSVSCVGRRLVLGERTEEEVEAIVDGAPLGAAHVGFYSYGEISPGAGGGATELHNQTMTVSVFSED